MCDKYQSLELPRQNVEDLNQLGVVSRMVDSICIQVTHSRTGRWISHGYNPASFVAIRIGP